MLTKLLQQANCLTRPIYSPLKNLENLKMHAMRKAFVERILNRKMFKVDLKLMNLIKMVVLYSTYSSVYLMQIARGILYCLSPILTCVGLPRKSIGS